MNKFFQKRYLIKKEFTVSEDGVHYKEYSLFKSLEYFSDFIDLGFETAVIKDREGIGNVFLFTCMSIASASLFIKGLLEEAPKYGLLGFFGVFAVFMAFCSFWSLQTQITSFTYLRGGEKYLEFFTDKPSAAALAEFIDYLKTRIKEAYKRNYAAFDPDSSYENQLITLNWLRDRKIIDKVELAQLREELRLQHLIK